MPPPTPVTTPSHMNPTMSISLRDATRAPVTAKTAADARSKMGSKDVSARNTSSSVDQKSAICPHVID